MIYAYMRVSTQSQAEANGIQMQEVAIAKYCEDNNIKLDGTFSDLGISGTDYTRDGLTELLNALSSNDRILVLNTSRLWRDTTSQVMIQLELKKKNVDVISIEQPKYSIYTKEPTDFLVNGLIELLDGYERLQIAMKLAKGRSSKVIKDKSKACGTAPFGYKWSENATIVIDYNNHLIVQDIFKKYLELKSLAELQRYTIVMGYKTNRGNEFSKQALSNILHNDFYIGYVTHGDIKVLGEHEPIITEQVFTMVQNV